MPVIFSLVFESLEKQYGYHSHPDLTHHGILVCADKGFDAQMLFYGIKKAFYMPMEKSTIHIHKKPPKWEALWVKRF